MPTLHESALWYAQNGYPVLPLQPGQKIPDGALAPHGSHSATTNPEQVNEWWEARPDANIGLATGHLFDAIDFDGPEAITHIDTWPAELWDQLIASTIALVATPRHEGYHQWITPQDAPMPKALRGNHIDYRGKGGYVLAPPSVLDARAGRNYAGTYAFITNPGAWRVEA